MPNVTITNGTVKYGRTVKTGDFESKRGDVELSFTVAEGEDANAAITKVERMAIGHVFDILGVKEDSTRAVHVEVAKSEKEKPAKAPKMPTAVKPAVIEPVDDLMSDIDGTISQTVAPVVESVDDGLGDLLGESVTEEITDKELMDAAQKCQSANKNSPAIRKILSDLGVKVPPGRIIDVPQAKRQTFLDSLKEVKPLA